MITAILGFATEKKAVKNNLFIVLLISAFIFDGVIIWSGLNILL